MSHRPGVVTLTPEIWVATRGNALLEDLSASMLTGRASVDYQNAVPGSFTGTFKRPGAFGFYADSLAVFLTTAYGDGTSSREQVGLYVPLPSPRVDEETHAVVEIDARDFTWLLAADVTDDVYDVAAGTKYTAAVGTLLTSAGFTRFTIPASGKALAAALTFEPGTSKLEIANHLLQGAGYDPLACDRSGAFVSRPIADLSALSPVAAYVGGDGSRIVGGVRRVPDATNLCNKVVVVRDDPSQALVTATAVNDNPASPTSTVALGVTIARFVNDPHLADQAAADALARKLLEEGSALYETLTLETLPDLAEIDGRVVSLDVANEAGETVAEGNWWRRGWSLSLGEPGLLQHSLAKLVPFEAV